MAFEDSFFKRKTANVEKLLAFGFEKSQDGYDYHQAIMEDSFDAQIHVSLQGEVSGRLIDKDLNEEYTAIHVVSSLGNYVGQVREAYGQLLEEIAQACFDETPFEFPQTNRLAAYLKETYGDVFDHPFEKYPQYASYRHPANRKWYALIFNLKMSKLSSENPSQKELDKSVEVINLKIDKKDLETFLAIEGIYPSYHMNKQSWISVLLDDSLSDDILFSLVETSRQLVGPKSYQATDGPDYWVIPANPKYYDIDAEFLTSDEILWTQKAKIKKGDWVFIYMTGPIQAIRYACEVLEANLPNNAYRDHKEIKTLMKIKKVKKFNDETLSRAVMQEHGVKAVRGPRRLTKALIDKIKKEL